MKHCPEAVEQLERSEDLALHQDARDDCCGGPPSGAHGHLEEPLFERQLAQSAAISTTDNRSHAVRGVSSCRLDGRGVVVE